MFCPVCNAEYRAGFTRCVDCDVDLVSALPENQTGGGAGEHDPFVPVWSGGRPDYSRVCAALQSEQVRYRVIEAKDTPFPLELRGPYTILVPPAMLGKARAALGCFTPDSDKTEDEYEQATDQQVELPGDCLQEAEEPLTSGETWDPEGWDPEDATSSIWSGTDEDLAKGISACLEENYIHWRLDGGDDAGTGTDLLKLFVLPADESRANEIVREITEGQSPKA